MQTQNFSSSSDSHCFHLTVTKSCYLLCSAAFQSYTWGEKEQSSFSRHCKPCKQCLKAILEESFSESQAAQTLHFRNLSHPHTFYWIYFFTFEPGPSWFPEGSVIWLKIEQNKAVCTEHRRPDTDHDSVCTAGGQGLEWLLSLANPNPGKLTQKLVLCWYRKAAFPAEAKLDAFMFWVCFQP